MTTIVVIFNICIYNAYIERIIFEMAGVFTIANIVKKPTCITILSIFEQINLKIIIENYLIKNIKYDILSTEYRFLKSKPITFSIDNRLGHNQACEYFLTDKIFREAIYRITHPIVYLNIIIYNDFEHFEKIKDITLNTLCVIADNHVELIRKTFQSIKPNTRIKNIKSSHHNEYYIDNRYINATNKYLKTIDIINNIHCLYCDDLRYLTCSKINDLIYCPKLKHLKCTTIRNFEYLNSLKLETLNIRYINSFDTRNDIDLNIPTLKYLSIHISDYGLNPRSYVNNITCNICKYIRLHDVDIKNLIIDDVYELVIYYCNIDMLKIINVKAYKSFRNNIEELYINYVFAYSVSESVIKRLRILGSYGPIQIEKSLICNITIYQMPPPNVTRDSKYIIKINKSVALNITIINKAGGTIGIIQIYSSMINTLTLKNSSDILLDCNNILNTIIDHCHNIKINTKNTKSFTNDIIAYIDSSVINNNLNLIDRHLTNTEINTQNIIINDCDDAFFDINNNMNIEINNAENVRLNAKKLIQQNPNVTLLLKNINHYDIMTSENINYIGTLDTIKNITTTEYKQIDNFITTNNIITKLKIINDNNIEILILTKYTKLDNLSILCCNKLNNIYSVCDNIYYIDIPYLSIEFCSNLNIRCQYIKIFTLVLKHCRSQHFTNYELAIYNLNKLHISSINNIRILNCPNLKVLNSHNCDNLCKIIAPNIERITLIKCNKIKYINKNKLSYLKLIECLQIEYVYNINIIEYKSIIKCAKL